MIEENELTLWRARCGFSVAGAGSGHMATSMLQTRDCKATLA